MATEIVTQAEREVVEFLADSPSPTRILAFHQSPAVAGRAYALISVEREGTLSESERKELDTYLYLEHFVRMLKIEARRKLQQQATEP